jgi:hypothetical protein
VITYIRISFTFIQVLIPATPKEIERYYSIKMNLIPFQFRGGEDKEETGIGVDTMRSTEEMHTGTRGEQ